MNAKITETSDAAALYPATLTQSASYNNLNELTSLSGQARTYDLNGNLLTDGQRSYAWDAENRLVGITYPGAPGKATAFTYDGLDRRVAIGETPTGGGSATTTRYAWCGASLCQSRDASGARLRSYYGEGEFVAGTPGQSLFYGLDQVGSVRRVFASASSAPAYAYDPHGVPLGATTPITDFTYAGLLNHPASGLYLAQYRGYDAPAGRWLTRDPIGEISDPATNQYRYANGAPVYLTDASGQFGLLASAAVGAAVGAGVGGTVNLAYQLYQNGGNLSCIDPIQVAAAASRSAIDGAWLGLTFGLGASARSIFTTSVSSDVQTGIDPNKIQHIFGNENHALSPLVEQYGSKEMAYQAISDAVTNQISPGSGLYTQSIQVGGQTVTVTGAFVGGIPRIGTAFIK